MERHSLVERPSPWRGKPHAVLAFGDPRLRRICAPVEAFTKRLRSRIDDLAATLAWREDGAALAAPQIGWLVRVVVVDYQDEYLELVNPRLLDAQGMEVGEEGCLSLGGFVGKVPRARQISLAYQDRWGREHRLTREGAQSRCLQHEMDHLDGILYPDRMSEDRLVHVASNSTVPRTLVLERAGLAPGGGTDREEGRRA